MHVRILYFNGFPDRVTIPKGLSIPMDLSPGIDMSDPNADNPDVSDIRSLAIASARLPRGVRPFVILIFLVLSAMLSGHVIFGNCQADNGIPAADLDVSTTRPEIDEMVFFNASGSTDDGDVVAYFFDFGDEKNSSWITNSTVTHSYDETFKEFDARVKVRDNAGQESNWSETATINVQEKVPVNPDIFLVVSFIAMALVTAVALAFLLKADDSEDEISVDKIREPESPKKMEKESEKESEKGSEKETEIVQEVERKQETGVGRDERDGEQGTIIKADDEEDARPAKDRGESH